MKVIQVFCLCMVAIAMSKGESLAQLKYGVEVGSGLSLSRTYSYFKEDRPYSVPYFTQKTTEDPQIAYQVTLFASKKFGKKFSMQSELFYANKGIKSVTDIDGIGKKIGKGRYNSIGLSLLANYVHTEKWQVGIGPILEYIVNRKSKVTYYFSNTTSVHTSKAGYNKLAFVLQQRVTRTINERLSLGLEFQGNLFGILDNYYIKAEGQHPIDENIIMGHKMEMYALYFTIGYSLN